MSESLPPEGHAPAEGLRERKRRATRQRIAEVGLQLFLTNGYESTTLDAIAAEAGELLQHFVWQQPDQIDARLERNRDEIASEIADVAILLFEFADNLGYRLGDVMADKIARNEQRYPVAKSRGNNLKYSEL